jgi:tungstate transport system ATP-binding protein
VIELVGVSKLFGDVTALKDVSLKVERGEILTVLGPNGSGKTTLLKIIAALEMPSHGKALFDGVRIGEDNAERMRKRATLVFQRTVLLRGTVKDNVAYGLRFRDIPEDDVERRVKEALELVGLEALADRQARDLSGGEQQRLSLARALVLGCELLLLDEPTANLDPESLAIVKDVIKELSEGGTTIVMATHNLDQAEEISERILLLDHGEIVEEGRPEDLLLDQSSEMARFARSENVFTGDSRMVSGVAHIDIGGEVIVRGAFTREGQTTIHVRPEDIIVSREKMESSARNNILGTIVGIEDHNYIIRLRVDVGKVFTIQITRRSLVEMGLNVGQEVYITFKASSVQRL